VEIIDLIATNVKFECEKLNSILISNICSIDSSYIENNITDISLWLNKEYDSIEKNDS
jgi:hypothetical protein